jgi:hypothetical protein
MYGVSVDHARQPLSERLSKSLRLALAGVTFASASVSAVGGLIDYFWGSDPRPSPMWESIFVGFSVFVAVNVATLAIVTDGATLRSPRLSAWLKRYRGMFRWLGGLATSVLSGVITEIVTSHLHR